ncbi:hypothetical protein B9Z19DRAFT_1141323 [Tuber borchii]|uniref:Uncharacterized protein n=1 Tax=Tuber borchii TaxID=42251 RepID=A0A2T6ZTE8_TUBBO|nr:hypothetical protein B9Z19DRAFT_1141323 [Tuber borchii]
MTTAVIPSVETDGAVKAEMTPRFTEPTEAPGRSGGPSKSLRNRVGEGEDDDESTPIKKPKLLNKDFGACGIQPQIYTRRGPDDVMFDLMDKVHGILEAFDESENYPAGPKIAKECCRTLAHLMPIHILEVFVQTYLIKMRVEKKVRAFQSHFV